MGEAAWLEVSLMVDGELAEAVADVLARFAPNGVVVEATRIIPDPDGDGHPGGPLRVAAYLPVDEHLEETRRRLEEALWYLGRIQPLPAAQFKPIEETDWSESWKQHYRPVPIGEHLMIVPAWLHPPTEGRIPIRIDPGMAFGTGTHPTTQLCLQFVDELVSRWVQAGQAIDVIDVGCGTAILSVAALKLGARHALGVDIDQQAVDAALQNAVANQVEDRLELGPGSLAEIASGSFSIQRAPLVLANILAPVIIRLLDDGLATLLTPGGDLVLSGILEEQAEGVEAAVRRHALQLIERRQEGDWVALRAAAS